MWAMKAVMFDGPRERLADAAQGAPAGAAAPAEPELSESARVMEAGMRRTFGLKMGA